MKYIGKEESVIIPQTVNGKPVLHIQQFAFERPSHILKKIVIPDGVLSIGSQAFQNCTHLTEIVIPDSVRRIAGMAFADCSSLTDIWLPDHLMDISQGLFTRCSNLKRIVIPEGVRTIGEDAFISCFHLTEVILPHSLTCLENGAFRGCLALAAIEIPESVTEFGYDVFRNTEWMQLRRSENPLVIVNHTLLNGKSCSGSVVIPEQVSVIAPYAMERGSMTEVILPQSVRKIGGWAFSQCSRLNCITILNPECEIFDDSQTISNSAKRIGVNRYAGIYDGVIRGFLGSAAQAYAEKYGLKFEEIK